MQNLSNLKPTTVCFTFKCILKIWADFNMKSSLISGGVFVIQFICANALSFTELYVIKLFSHVKIISFLINVGFARFTWPCMFLDVYPSFGGWLLGYYNNRYHTLAVPLVSPYPLIIRSVFPWKTLMHLVNLILQRCKKGYLTSTLLFMGGG